MKALQSLFILLCLCTGAFAQNKKAEASFRKACTAIADAFAKQNFKTLNKYVHNETGVYIITRPGAIDALTHCDSLEMKCFAFYPYKDPAGAKKPAVKYGTAPRFSCGDNKWDKKGFVADTATRYHRVSELMSFLAQNQMGSYDAAKRESVNAMENKSRKVVHTGLAKNHGLVFYLTCIKGRWYLTILDTVASSCAA
jgi:hypothetical protein